MRANDAKACVEAGSRNCKDDVTNCRKQKSISFADRPEDVDRMIDDVFSDAMLSTTRCSHGNGEAVYQPRSAKAAASNSIQSNSVFIESIPETLSGKPEIAPAGQLMNDSILPRFGVVSGSSVSDGATAVTSLPVGCIVDFVPLSVSTRQDSGDEDSEAGSSCSSEYGWTYQERVYDDEYGWQYVTAV